MPQKPSLTVLAFLLAVSTSSRQMSGQARETAVVTNAAAVLDDICRKPDQGVPRSLLSNATAVAIIPDVVKIGFIAAGRRGKGTVLVRQKNGTWSNPIFVTLTGGGIGFQAGVQATDIILVFKSRESVAGMLNGKFTLGADAAVAAGPVGRQAAAATDAQLKAEILSYSRSRGLFAGVSLDGSALTIDHNANAVYYGISGVTPADVFTNKRLAVPPATVKLQATLARYSGQANNVAPAAPLVSGPAMQAQNALQVSGQFLANSTRQLYSQLDERWRDYLAVPSSVLKATEKPSIPELEKTLRRFNTVELDPKYDAVSKLASFQTAKQALIQYIRVAKSQSAPRQSALPRPPAIQPRR